MPSCSNCDQAIEAGVRFCPTCGTKVVTVATSGDPLLGKTLSSKYRVLEHVGTGSMGTVYRAEHIALRKKIALKVLRSDLQVTEETMQRFQREGIAAGKFTHPNAIQIFDFDRDEGLLYLAMEFVDGRNITQLLGDEGRVPVATAIDIVRQILSALAEAHDHGIIHRDLKPENVMVMRGVGGSFSVKVLDFGLSKLIGQPLGASMATEVGRVMGTPLYMAPEQGGGEEVDLRSDLYSVGLILFELLSGRPPFQADTFVDLLRKQATEPPPRLGVTRPELGVPPRLDDVIQTALAKARSDRFQSANAMLEAMHHLEGPSTLRVASGAAAGAQPPQADARAEASPPGRTLRLPLLLAGVVLAVGGWFVATSVLGFGSGNSAGSEEVRVSQKPVDQLDEEERTYLGLLESTRASLASGDVNAAMGSAQEALRSQCHDAEAFLLRALVYRARRDDDTALVDLEEALSMDPGYAQAAATIGWIHVDRGQLEQAQARFESVASMPGDSVQGLFGQGAVSYLRSDLAQAKELLTQAVERDGEDARGQHYLGRTLLDAGDTEGARAAFIQAKRIDANMALAVVGLGQVYLAEDRLRDAEARFREAVELAPDEIEPLLHLASLLLDAERVEDALEVLAEPLRRHPGWKRLQVLRGVALAARGDDEAAIRALEIGVDDDAVDARAHVLLGILHRGAGDTEAALAQYRAAARADAKLAEAHLNEGLLLLESDRSEEAVAALERAVAIDPENAFAHYTLGVLYMDHLGQGDQALVHLEAFLEYGGPDARVSSWVQRLAR